MSTAVAPLPAESLEAVLTEEFHQARTLPAAAYLSDDVLAWEREHFVRDTWMCVGRSDLVPEPKSQLGVDVAGEGVVLARGLDGVLRGFYNFCRHRGHELLAPGECKRRSTIACPYHSWAYALDGSLRTATRFEGGEGFDPAEFGLVPVAVREWCGWIFVNASNDAVELEDWLGNLTGYVGDWHIEDLRIGAKRDYDVACNWKLILENFLECYHCPSIHPELCRVSPPDSARALAHTGMWLGGPMELREHAATMSLDGTSSAMRIPGLSDEQARRVYYYILFPNMLISPHPDYVMCHRIQPITPTVTRVECSWLFPQEAIARDDFDPSFAVDFWHVTNAQDLGACEAVQRGLSSGGYVPGPFDAGETGVYALQAMLAKAYLTGTLELPPADNWQSGVLAA